MKQDPSMMTENESSHVWTMTKVEGMQARVRLSKRQTFVPNRKTTQNQR
jgi:hypothetical protein